MKKLLIFMFVFLLTLSFASAFDWDDGTLIAYWEFEDQTSEVNSTTYDLLAHTTSPTIVDDGLLGKGSNFTGNDGNAWRITTQTTEIGLNRTDQNFAISWWERLYEEAAAQQMFSNRISTGFYMYLYTDEKLYLANFNDGSGEFGSSGTLTKNIWQHIIITKNSSHLCMYFNGVQDSCQARTGDVVDYDGVNMTIGCNGNPSGTYSVHGTLDEIGFWARNLSVSEISELYNGGIGLAYAGGIPLVDLISPEDNSAIAGNATNFTANYSAPHPYNLTNATYYVWDSTGSIFNNSVVVYLNGTTNSTNEYINNFTLGHYDWNIYACYGNDTFNNCSFATANYSFDVGATVDAESYNSITYETSSERFGINITLLEGSTLYGVQLIYNGTPYDVSDITNSGDSYYLIKTIDIPTNPSYFSNTTRNFYWRFIYVGEEQGGQNTTTRQQSVGYIVLNICNATYITTLNFTYYDEITSTEINSTENSTSIQTTFNYYLGGGSTYKNYSYTNLTNNLSSQYQFCIYPKWQSFRTDMDLEYEAVGYSSRTYYLRNASITNVTNEIKLNLLEIEDSIKFFIDVKQGMNPFTEAVVTISKYFTGEGIYRTISIRETDEDGEFIEYLDLDQRYKFLIVKDGVSYGSIIKQASCEEAPCKLSLQLSEAVVDLWQGYYAVFAENVAYSLTYNDTSKNVTYTFNDLTGLAQYFRLLVTQISYNQTGEVICNTTLYTTAGTIICDLSAYTDGDFRATGYISRSPERTVDYIMIALRFIKRVLGETGILMALILIVTIGLVGAWNPAVGVILTAFAILMMKMMGFVAFSYTTVILIFIMAIILIKLMKT